ncbi:hypothetical protein FAVG1_09327 [Fusarium avenaceum]|nr:hypothetical protein FAVG1_09327 [Fusarium avenaceum]
MTTKRARQLLDELLKEPGVSAVLLPSSGGRVGVRLDMATANEVEEEEIKALFGEDRLPIRRGTKRKLEKEEEEEEEESEVEAEDTDERLLEIFKHNSGRECHRLRPDVWTTHGKWNRRYKHLEGLAEKETTGAGGSNGRVTNRPWVSWFELNGTRIQAGFVCQQADDYQRIIIAFTRASSAPPTYGLQGMFVRAGTAAKAWSGLEPTSTSLITAIPRARVASKWPLEETRATTKEMITILNAAANGMTVELLSVGIDGLTTDVSSIQWLQSTWGHRLRLRLVIVVGQTFPGTMESFPVAANTIRYGEFELRDVCEVLMDPQTPGKANSKELVDLILQVREMKLDRDEGYTPLNRLTSGRANFRVCPDSAHESGVEEDSRQSRALH